MIDFWYLENLSVTMLIAYTAYINYKIKCWSFLSGYMYKTTKCYLCRNKMCILNR